MERRIMFENVHVYMVGGAIRDKYLGIPSKDIDFAVEAESYEEMRDFILARGKIYLEHPEFFTIRAHISSPDLWNGDADFVLCRKEGTYKDGRRPDNVYVGDIYDDLGRRDFTMNAIADGAYPLSLVGDVIDPYNGRADIKRRIIRCVGDPRERFEEDALRMVRALRFAITKNMTIDAKIMRLFLDPHYLQLLQHNISEDRKKDELLRMFRHNTLRSLELIFQFPELCEVLFGGASNVWLKPTLENR